GAQLEPGMDQHKALETLASTLDKVSDQPFVETDLERIRNKWLTGWSRTFADPIQLASALSEAVAEGDWRLFFLHRDQVENATLDDVQRVTSAYLVPSNRTSGLYIPTDDPIRAPQAPAVDLAELLDGYTGNPESDLTAAFDPSPENIDAS